MIVLRILERIGRLLVPLCAALVVVTSPFVLGWQGLGVAASGTILGSLWGSWMVRREVRRQRQREELL